MDPAYESRLAEAAATGAAGAVLGSVAGSLVGFGTVGAFVGGANGLISGWRRIYAWKTRRGVTAFALDSTWAIASTSASLASHLMSQARHRMGGADSAFVSEWSERQNRHVYGAGFVVRKGFALTVGNVVTGAAGPDGTLSDRRRRLVDDHEDVHVWQARTFGPLYPVAYVGWTATGAVVGTIAWLFRGRREPLSKVVDTVAYYANPFEWWAYSRDDNWPPAGVVQGLAWRQPAVTSFASVRATGGTRAGPR